MVQLVLVPMQLHCESLDQRFPKLLHLFETQSKAVHAGADYGRLKAEPAHQMERKRNMADDELRAKGRAVRRKLMGEEYASKLDGSVYTDPIMEKFAQVTQENVFGALWTRPGLDLKIRSLICVISDAATGRAPELKLHLRFARNQGWTEDELAEALVHLTGYVGAPLVREAMLTAVEVFKEMREEH
jgi:4-carboxymuconolactone decarboxylase